MSASDSDTNSSGSVTATDPPSHHLPSNRTRPPPRHASYPRRQSSLSDASNIDLTDPRTSIALGSRGPVTYMPSGSSSTGDTLAALDRKRRLTSSAQDHGRRRQGPGALAGGPRDDGLDPVEETQSGLSASSSRLAQQHEVVDLTGSSPPIPRTPHRQRQQSRTSSSSSRRYVVPSWQPDSEVPDCPICGRTFTWLFRRHHCRKCGRVVCNDCSPHRITIPRQFIVNPPSPDGSTSPGRNDGIRVETIDLTGDDDGDGRSSSRYLGGGEKVRLCNPCVPDPQPEPLPNFLLSTDNQQPSRSLDAGPGSRREEPRLDLFSRSFRQPNRHRTGTLPTMVAPGSLTGSHTHSFSSFGARPRPSSFANPSPMLPHGYDPRFGSHNVSVSFVVSRRSLIAYAEPAPTFASHRLVRFVDVWSRSILFIGFSKLLRDRVRSTTTRELYARPTPKGPRYDTAIATTFETASQ